MAVLVDDEFIKCLFEAVEELSYDSSDPYHYPVIRVLVSVVKCRCLLDIGLFLLAAGSKRAIHDFGPRTCRRACTYEQGRQGSLDAWQPLQDVWREHHSLD